MKVPEEVRSFFDLSNCITKFFEAKGRKFKTIETLEDLEILQSKTNYKNGIVGTLKMNYGNEKEKMDSKKGNFLMILFLINLLKKDMNFSNLTFSQLMSVFYMHLHYESQLYYPIFELFTREEVMTFIHSSIVKGQA